MLDELSSRYRGGTFIDVGASIGNHTVYFGKCCSADEVYSFEPVNKSFEHLWENVRLNSLSEKVRAYNLALGAHDCTGQMVMPDGGNEGMWNFVPELMGTTVMKCLDYFNIDDVTLIKIDAEGYEADVLIGGIETIREHRPAIIAEANTDKDLEGIMEILEPLGYGVLKRHNVTPTYEIVA